MQEPEDLSIEGQPSLRRLRGLRPSGAVGQLVLTDGPLLYRKLAAEIADWQSVRSIWVQRSATPAAIRLLLSTQGLESIRIGSATSHGSLQGAGLSPKLTEFECSRLKAPDLEILAQIGTLTALISQHAQLSNSAVSAIGAMESLLKLDLEGSGFNDDMAVALAKNRVIEDLCLGATRLTRRGLQEICAMSQLKSLDVWAIDIDEVDLDFLALLPNLEWVSIGGHDGQTRLSAAGVLPRLEQMQSLRSLWLDGIKFTEREKAVLKARYERVQITYYDL